MPDPVSPILEEAVAASAFGENVAQAVADRRAELLKRREVREQLAALRKADLELQCLELEELWTQKLGARGVEFEIVNEENDCDEGPIVLKRGEVVRYKAFMAKPGAVYEDQFSYVVDSVVYPERAAFTAIVGRRPELLARCTIVLHRLFGFSDAEIKKK
jgi:hypothetical protein